MKVFTSVNEFQKWRRDGSLLGERRSIGFVPTMGALHEGHRTLLEKSKSENEMTVLSIFVNPTQFNQAEDFEKYPQTADDDLKMAESSGVDVVLMPSEPKEIYTDSYRYSLHESKESHILEGVHRPGHFNGVLTVVLKLFQIVQPLKAYFGEKDFQQLTLIRGMVDAFFLPLTVVAVPTVRAQSGLALSSRNRRLSATDLEIAPFLHKVLTTHESLEEGKSTLEKAGFTVEYLAEHWGRRLVAAQLGGIRLIDNISLEEIKR